MGVDWTGACSASSATQFNFDSITFVGGTGTHQNNGTFTNATWHTSNSSIPADGLPHSICVKVYHASFSGAEGSSAATFSVAIVIPPPLPAHLTLIKTVTNNNGGTAVVGNWTLSAAGPTPISGTSGSGAVSNVSVVAGTYALSENGGPSGYTASTYSCIKNSGSPVAGNSITLAPGDGVICTINNDDQPGTLVVKKVVINDNGGTKVNSDFSFQVNGGAPVAFESDGQNDLTVNAGAYSVTEPAVSGYSTSYSNCTNVVVANGGSATCTITNNDIGGKLIVKKQTTRWFGTFGFTVSNQSHPLSPFELTTNADNNPATQSFFDVFADVYGVAENALSGWSQTSANCDNENPVNAVHVGIGQTVTCTFVNDALPGTLTVIKHVADNRDGAPSAGNFTIGVNGGTPSSFPGNETGTQVSIPAGTNYLVQETDGPKGYAVDYSGACGETMIPGGNKTCTVTNTPTTGSLTVRKVWIEDNGGTASVGQLTLTVSNGEDFSQNVTSGQSIEVAPGTYTVSESDVPGYTQSFSGACGQGGTVTVVAGQSSECVITNNDIQPKLTVNKQVSDEREGYQPSFFDIFVDLGQVDIGGTNGFNAGTHRVTEGLAGENSFPPGVGYTQSFSGACGENGNVTLNPGDNATCTITNTITYDTIPPVSSFDDARNHQFIDTELVSLSLTGHSTDNLSGVASAEMDIYRIADQDTVLSDNFRQSEAFEALNCSIPQDAVPIQIIALSLTGSNPLDKSWSHVWNSPDRGAYCAIVHATDAAGNVEHTGTAGPFVYAAPLPPAPPSGGGGGDGGGSGGGGGSNPPGPSVIVSGGNPPQVLGASTVGASTVGGGSQGEVLGAAVCSVQYLRDYLRQGKKNDSEQVKLLQQFLNKNLGLSLPTSGFFGQLTRTAVEQFQIKHKVEVLRPWLAYGLPNESTPTGYVYKTTKRWINLLECPDLGLPMPQLP